MTPNETTRPTERIFVHESLYEQFVEGATELMDRYVYGDPLSEDVNLGPIATEFVLLFFSHFLSLSLLFSVY